MAEEKKARFASRGKSLIRFAAENDAATVANAFRGYIFSELTRAIKQAGEDVTLFAAHDSLLGARELLSAFAQYVQRPVKRDDGAKFTHKVRFTFKPRAPEKYRVFITGFGRRFGYEVSSNDQNGSYVFAFPKDKYDALMAKAKDLVDVEVSPVRS